ncbi:hypothetical protein [Hymenobacter jejuensis]|uniref:Glycosyl transferase n=1 Tax=Hymenobacter jejuensis TaxID=2502781 RepID=A0A5B7ZZP9_9BACT|nr:hypothetical protein [Hymenobacter jejuensis]QDA59342.1 hypothetical protein FHG12_04140 [Hymenobacter jejuensis]
MSQPLKVEFCVAYDWYFLAHSIPLVYAEADAICLALDKDRISWAGQPFSFDEQGFRELVTSLDPEGKITVYEDDFHLPDLAPMQNESRQRRLMAERMGEGGWHIQLDADEYFLNFSGFAAWLHNFKSSRPLNIRCPYITLFKQLDEGFLVVEQPDYFKLDGNPVATNKPAYQYGRISEWFNIYAPFYILHQSWARAEDEIREKVSNWGHKNDFDTDGYLRFWLGLNTANFQGVRNFNPLKPATWPGLQLVPARQVEDLVTYYNAHPPLVPNKARLAWENSVWASRFRKILSAVR